LKDHTPMHDPFSLDLLIALTTRAGRCVELAVL
jgi:hypothetical protein